MATFMEQGQDRVTILFIISSTALPNVCTQTPTIQQEYQSVLPQIFNLTTLTQLTLSSILSLNNLIIGAFTLLTSRFLKSRHFDPTIYTCAKNRRDILVGSAHVRSQATVHAFMHAVCMRAEDIDTRFKERA